MCCVDLPPPPPPALHSYRLSASRLLWASRAASYLRISTFNRAFSTVLKDLKYAETHEWVKIDGDSATVGITDHAQDHLGDVVYVELPEMGGTVGQGANFGAVESVKATCDIISPVSGKVVEVNDQLSEAPGLEGILVRWVSRAVDAQSSNQEEARAVLEEYMLLQQFSGGEELVLSDSKETVDALSCTYPINIQD